MILYSKLPLKEQEINFLVDDDIPSFYTKVTLPDGQTFDLYTLHPKPPKPGTPTYDRDTEILLIGRRIRKSDQPALVVGDLNDVGWSYTSSLFQRYSQMLDPRVGRGLYNTYSVSMPLFRYPLDHFFYSKHFGFVGLEKLQAFGSDHFPMLLKVNLQREKNYKDNLSKPGKADKEEVKETINQEDR
jgi:endonuclease/exonuclease/phosphatase (EEP) superfamily protein YafD